MYPKQTVIATLLLLSAPLIGVKGGKDKKDDKVIHIASTTPPVYTCPEGFEQRGVGELTSCLQHFATKPLSVCKVGELHGEQCVAKEPIVYTCPPGYYTSEKEDKDKKGKKGGVCAQVLTAPALAICHNTPLNHGDRCVHEEVAPVLHVCPIGGKKEKKKAHDCYDWISVPSSLKCKPGYDLLDNTCYGVETQPCPSQNDSQDVLCVGYGCAGKGGHLRRLGKKEDKKSSGKIPLCQVKVQAAPYEVCPDGTMVTEKKKQGGCLRQVEVPLEPYCPLDSGVIDHDGQTCRVTVSEEPDYQCPDGFKSCEKKGKSSECCRVEYAPPFPSCSQSGTIYESHCATFYPISHLCEEGFALVDGVCKGYKAVPPKIQYSVNFKMLGNVIPPPVKK